MSKDGGKSLYQKKDGGMFRNEIINVQGWGEEGESPSTKN